MKIYDRCGARNGSLASQRLKIPDAECQGNKSVTSRHNSSSDSPGRLNGPLFKNLPALERGEFFICCGTASRMTEIRSVGFPLHVPTPQYSRSYGQKDLSVIAREVHGVYIRCHPKTLSGRLCEVGNRRKANLTASNKIQTSPLTNG